MTSTSTDLVCVHTHAHTHVCTRTHTHTHAHTQIIDKDLIKPIGIAVDWKGNNVYFSDRRCQQNICFDPVGRVEVSTCDGAYRKVLFHNLISPGPLAINVLTG